MSIGPTEGEHLTGKKSTYQNRLSTQNLKPINLSKCSYQRKSHPNRPINVAHQIEPIEIPYQDQPIKYDIVG
jgi:hypothetical protein